MDTEDSNHSENNHESPQRPRARRGRGRGVGRGRNRGNRRPRRGGHQAQDAPNRAETAAATREEREAQLKQRINLLTEDRKAELLFKACEQYPSFTLNITDECSSQARETGQGYHPSPDDSSPSWCSCTRCREMPTEMERLCCRQTPENCFSTLPDSLGFNKFGPQETLDRVYMYWNQEKIYNLDFDLIAQDNLVLALNQRYREDIFAYAPDDDFNRGRRHAAYRHFILWQHGFLGAGNRRVIPSCCVWKIRDRFPDNFGQYRGFVGGRLG